MSELEGKIAECIAEHAPSWNQIRRVGEAVLGRRPSGRGTKRQSKGRYLSILPRGEDGRALAIAILESLSLPVSSRVRLWKPSARADRVIVLWEQTGDVSPVRVSSIRGTKAVKSLDTIVMDFGSRRSSGRERVSSCRGLVWT